MKRCGDLSKELNLLRYVVFSNCELFLAKVGNIHTGTIGSTQRHGHEIGINLDSLDVLRFFGWSRGRLRLLGLLARRTSLSKHRNQTNHKHQNDGKGGTRRRRKHSILLTQTTLADF